MRATQVKLIGRIRRQIEVEGEERKEQEINHKWRAFTVLQDRIFKN